MSSPGARGMAERAVPEDAQDSVLDCMEDFIPHIFEQRGQIVLRVRQGGQVKDQACVHGNGKPIPPNWSRLPYPRNHRLTPTELPTPRFLQRWVVTRECLDTFL